MIVNLLDKMNTAIDYVENNITDELNLSKLAQLAECSTYNFQRMFSFIADISITEYVRRRRLTLAALELQSNDSKVIDIALKYGYESPVSFARAFQAMHGITPREAKKSNISLKAFPKMTFQIIIKGVNEMNYRIVKTEPFEVFGLEGIISTAGSADCFTHAGEIWKEYQSNGKYDQLSVDAGEITPLGHETMFVKDMCHIHGLMNYKKINDTTYGYMLCSFVTSGSKTAGYEVFEVPATTWAVFPIDLNNWDVGEAIAKANKMFYSEWLPTSEYEKADSAEFEMYGGTPEKGYIEFWMPVVKKN